MERILAPFFSPLRIFLPSGRPDSFDRVSRPVRGRSACNRTLPFSPRSVLFFPDIPFVWREYCPRRPFYIERSGPRPQRPVCPLPFFPLLPRFSSSLLFWLRVSFADALRQRVHCHSRSTWAPGFTGNSAYSFLLLRETSSLDFFQSVVRESTARPSALTRRPSWGLRAHLGTGSPSFFEAFPPPLTQTRSRASCF